MPLQESPFNAENGESHNLFTCLSIVFYGHTKYRDRVKEMICSFESEEDHKEMLLSLIPCAHEKNKSNMATEHVTKIRAETYHPDEAEFFAAASIFNIPIFLDKNGDRIWSVYMPLTGSYGNPFQSHVVLTKVEEAKYRVEINTKEQCLCQQKQPVVKGKLEPIKEQIFEEITTRLGMFILDV